MVTTELETKKSSVDEDNLDVGLNLTRPDWTEVSKQQKSAWYAINNFLGQHERFLPGSKLSRYVQERLDFITDGRKVEVIIVHAKDPNAFALPDKIVFTDGLLKMLDHQEELDGLLAHEWTHIKRQHHNRNEKYIFESIGARRGGEMEADAIPMELLDRKGINPFGLIQVFRKLEPVVEREVKKRKMPEWIGKVDIEHGSLMDRRINLEELGRIIDIRNLSHSLTPLEIDQADYSKFESDYVLDTSSYDRLEDLSKRHYLQRRLASLIDEYEEEVEKDQVDKSFPGWKPKNYRAPDEEFHKRAEHLVKRQKELLKKIDPSLSQEEMDALSYISIYSGYGIVNPPYHHIPAIMQNSGALALESWQKSGIGMESIKTAVSLLNSPILRELGIKLDPIIILKVAGPFIAASLVQAEHINIAEYISFISSQDVEEDSAVARLYVDPLVRALEEKGVLDKNLNQLIESLVLTPVDPKTIHDDTLEITYNSEQREKDRKGRTTQFTLERPSSIPRDRRDIALPMALLEGVYARRIGLARKIDDPIERFVFLNSHKQDYYDEGRDYVKPRNSVLQEIVSKYPLSKIQVLLKQHHIDLQDKTLGQFIVESYSGKTFELAEDPYIALEPERMSNLSSSDLSPDRFLLWSICLDKQDFIKQVQEDLMRFKIPKYTNFELLLQVADAISKAPQKAKELGFSVNWDIEAKDYEHFDKLLQAAVVVCLQKGKMEDIERLVETLPVYGREADQETVEGETGIERTIQGGNLQQKWDRFANILLKDQTTIGTKEGLKKLFSLSLTSDNPQVLLLFAPKVLEAMIKRCSFEEGLQILTSTYEHLPRHIFHRALDYLIEYKAQNIDDLQKLEDIVRKELEEFTGNSQDMARLAFAELLFEPGKSFSGKTTQAGLETKTVHGVEPMRLLKALLNTGENDQALKQYLFERWWMAQRYGRDDIRKFFKVEDLAYLRYPGKDAQLKHWAKEIPPAGRYKPFSQAITDVYLSSEAVRYAVLRKILTGTGAALGSERDKKELVEAFLEGKVTFTFKEGEKVTRELTWGLMLSGTEEELYLLLNPIFMDMILKFPSDFYSYRELAKQAATRTLKDMHEHGGLPNPNQRDLDMMIDKILGLMLAGGSEQETLDLRKTEARLLSLFPQANGQEGIHKFNPWELALTIGEKSGAVGTRMLQLMGQYFDIPDEYRERLMDSYDRVKGQSRLQAYRVLKREAEHFPEIAQFMDNIAVFGERIGGGSLFTVYEVTLKNGKKEAVAVRNPNVEYSVEKIVNLLKRTLKHAQTKDPGNSNYQLLEILLDDVQEWIHEEINDPTFEEKDLRFRQQNDSSLQEEDQGEFRIVIPESQPTGSRWIRRDEFIEGKNLTSLTMTDNKTDIASGKINSIEYKQAISKLVKNYIHQIMVTGLVHSDVHPGNFRVTNDGKAIAVFDRYNLLELSEDDRTMISGLITSFMIGGQESIRDYFVDYVLGLDINAAHRDEKEAITGQLKKLGNEEEDLEKTIMDSIVALKRSGLKIPLKIALIGKNLQGLNRMTKDAGFPNIMEAYLTE